MAEFFPEWLASTIFDYVPETDDNNNENNDNNDNNSAEGGTFKLIIKRKYLRCIMNQIELRYGTGFTYAAGTLGINIQNEEGDGFMLVFDGLTVNELMNAEQIFANPDASAELKANAKRTLLSHITMDDFQDDVFAELTEIFMICIHLRRTRKMRKNIKSASENYRKRRRQKTYKNFVNKVENFNAFPSDVKDLITGYLAGGGSLSRKYNRRRK